MFEYLRGVTHVSPRGRISFLVRCEIFSTYALSAMHRRQYGRGLRSVNKALWVCFQGAAVLSHSSAPLRLFAGTDLAHIEKAGEEEAARSSTAWGFKISGPFRGRLPVCLCACVSSNNTFRQHQEQHQQQHQQAWFPISSPSFHPPHPPTSKALSSDSTLFGNSHRCGVFCFVQILFDGPPGRIECAAPVPVP